MKRANRRTKQQTVVLSNRESDSLLANNRAVENSSHKLRTRVRSKAA
jgi:hypothetical protein